MNFGEVAGCCAATNLYNVGGAHSYPRAKDQEEWDLRFLNQEWRIRSLVFCITNSEQAIERGYLEKMGFKTSKHEYGLYMSVISQSDLIKYMNSRNAELKQYQKEKKEGLKPKAHVFAGPNNAGVIFAERIGPNYRDGVWAGVVFRHRIVDLAQGLDWRNSIQERATFRENIRQYYGVGVTIFSDDDYDIIRRRVYNRLREFRNR